MGNGPRTYPSHLKMGAFPVKVAVVYFIVTRQVPPEVREGNGKRPFSVGKSSTNFDKWILVVGEPYPSTWLISMSIRILFHCKVQIPEGKHPQEWTAHSGLPSYEVAHECSTVTHIHLVIFHDIPFTISRAGENLFTSDALFDSVHSPREIKTC